MNKNNHCTACGGWLPRGAEGLCKKCFLYANMVQRHEEVAAVLNTVPERVEDHGVEPENNSFQQVLKVVAVATVFAAAMVWIAVLSSK